MSIASIEGHGKLGTRHSIRPIATHLAESMTEKLVLAEITPSLPVSGWALHSGSAFSSALAYTSDGVAQDVRSVRYDYPEPLVRVESIADVIATAGTYFHELSSVLVPLRWDDGVRQWDNSGLLDTGLVSLYEFEADGSDSVGSNDLTNASENAFVAGLQGNAYDQERGDTSDYWHGDFHDQTTTDFTFAMKFKMESNPAAMYMISRIADGSTPGWILTTLSSGNDYRLALRDGSVTYNIDFDGLTSPPDTAWHSFFVVVSRTANRVWVFEDGVFNTSSELTGLGSLAQANEFAIGNQNGKTTVNYDGLYDQVGIWDSSALFYRTREHAESGAVKFHAGTVGSAPVGETIPEEPTERWDQYSKVYVHLYGSEDPDDEEVSAGISLNLATRGVSFPALGPDLVTDGGLESYDANILTSGLVGHWKGEDDQDSSGNGNHLDTDLGTGYVFTAGLDGNALEGDGTNVSKRLQASGITVVNEFGSDSFSWGQKINIDTLGGTIMFMRMGAADGSNGGYKLFHNGSGSIRLAISDGTTVYTIDAAAATLTVDTWHSIFVVVSRITGKIYFYVDGVLQGTPTTIGGGFGSVSNAIHNFGIGVSPDSDGSKVDGHIDQTMIWGADAVFYGSVESATTAAVAYHSGLPGSVPAAVGMDDDSWEHVVSGTGEWDFGIGSSTVFKGSQSSALIATAATGAAYIRQDITGRIAGATYRVVGAYRTDVTAGTLEFHALVGDTSLVTQSDGRTTGAGSTVGGVITHGEWRQFSVDFVATGTTVRLDLGAQATAGTGIVYVDDIHVHRIHRFNSYEPRLSKGSIPQASQGANDIFFGGKKTTVGTIKWDTSDGLYDTLFGDLDFVNADVNVRVAPISANGREAEYLSFVPAFSGLCDAPADGDNIASAMVKDIRNSFHAKLPPDLLSREEFSELPTATEGKVRPLWFGTTENITPYRVLKSATTKYGTYELADTTLSPAGIKSIDAIYAYADTDAAAAKNVSQRVTLVSGTDYTVDLANGRFSIDKDVQLIEITDENNQIDFDEDGATELTATLSLGWYTPRLLVAEIKTKMEAVGAETYTITYDETTHLITIAHAGSTLNLLIKTGTHESKAYSLLGYDSTDDAGSATTYTAETALFDDEADSKHLLRVDGSGFKDDGSGTYTGSASSLITNPSDIVRVILIKYLKKSTSIIDETSFIAARAALIYPLAIYLDGILSTKAIFDKIELSSNSDIVINGLGLVLFKVRTSTAPADITDLIENDYINWSVKWRSTDVYKTIRVEYNLDPSTKEKGIFPVVTESAAVRFRRDAPRDFPTYLKTRAGAASIGGVIGGLAATPKRVVRFDVKGRCLAHGVSDIIRVTRGRAPDSTGAFSQKLFRILTIKHKHLEALSTVEAVEI